MRPRIRYRILALCLLAFAATSQAHERDALKVMTQNLYIGADVTNIANAPDVNQIPLLVDEAFRKVLASDFPSRAASFADQVMDARPDVIGLQEVSLIRIQELGDFLQGNPTPATEVREDFLQIVLDALESRGLHYKLAGVSNEVDSELPAFGDLDGDGVPSLYDLRLTDRDVILVRKSVKVSNVTPYNYYTKIYYPTPLGNIDYTRGAIAVDAKVRGQSYHLVNTHLEVRYDDNIAVVQALQMQELLGMLGDDRKRLVLMGDMNTTPTDTPDTYLGIPTAYQQAVGFGLSDIWLSGGEGPGYTCCHSESLNNLDETQTQRIDYIFVRNAADELPFSQVGKARAYTFSEVTRNDTWYSDHDGVFAKIHFVPSRGHRERGDEGEDHHHRRGHHDDGRD